MSMQKKAINKAQKSFKKTAGTKARATRLSGKSLAATKQMNLTKMVDASSPVLHQACANGQH